MCNTVLLIAVGLNLASACVYVFFMLRTRRESRRLIAMTQIIEQITALELHRTAAQQEDQLDA